MPPPCVQHCRGDPALLEKYARSLLKYYYTFDRNNFDDILSMLAGQGIQVGVDSLTDHFRCEEMDFCDDQMQKDCKLIQQWYERLKLTTQDVKQVANLDGQGKLVVNLTTGMCMELPLNDELISQLRSQYMIMFREYLDLDGRRTKDKKNLKSIIDFWLQNAEVVNEEDYGEDSEDQWVKDIAYEYIQSLRPTDNIEYALLDNFCYYKDGKGYCYRNNLIKYIESQTNRKVSLHKLTKISGDFTRPKRLWLGGKRYSFYEFEPNPDLLEESKEEELIESEIESEGGGD